MQDLLILGWKALLIGLAVLFVINGYAHAKEDWERRRRRKK